MFATKTLFILAILLSVFTYKSYSQAPGSRAAGPIFRTEGNAWNVQKMDSLLKIGNLNNFHGRKEMPHPGETSSSVVKKRDGGLIPGNRPNSGVKKTLTPLVKDRQNAQRAVCATVSGRDFLMQDSIYLYTGDPTLLADGNVIVSGEFADYGSTPNVYGAFYMKTDLEGNLIWGKLIDSANSVGIGFINLFRSIELKNGSILLAGRINNDISGNDDFILLMVDKDGNKIWSRIYESRYWIGFHGSGDYFNLKDLKEDPVTGEIYFVGVHWTGFSTITKVSSADGSVIWSNAYHTWNLDQPFGIVINDGDILLFQMMNNNSNSSFIDVTSISKGTGDTLSSKHLIQTLPNSSPRLFSSFGVVKMDNGHYRMAGLTLGFEEFPVYTGTVDLYHAGIVELDENLNFVKGFGFKNRLRSNLYNTKVTLFPDGSGVFHSLNVFGGGYSAEANVAFFHDDLIYHQRRRLHYNEGVPYEPPVIPLPNGGYVSIKVMGDSTVSTLDGSRIDYCRMHTSDTASACLGIKDTTTSIWHFYYEPNPYQNIDSVPKNVFSVGQPQSLTSWDFNATRRPSCVIVSHCDSLKLKADAMTICPGTTVTLTVQKNPECGSLVPIEYDGNFVQNFSRINDSTYKLRFDNPGTGYLKASLMGCTLKEDSVLIEVLDIRHSLDLGPDTVICPGNQLQLNAHRGFTSYLWQDGSTDSTLTVSAPGVYYVTGSNSCGTNFSDTIVIGDHPPIPLSLGPDRIRCNTDTLKLTAPPGFINYSWSSNYQINTLTGQEVIVRPEVDTIYSVIGEKTPGCFAYDTIRVSVRQSPAIDLGQDTSICRNDVLIIDAGPGFVNYEWTNGEAVRAIRVSQPGVYRIAASTVDGCWSYDTFALSEIYDLPKPLLGQDIVICKGSPATLNGGQFASYLWNTGAITRTISTSSAGEYWLSVIDQHGCRGADTMLIKSVEELPKLFLGKDTSICSYGNLLLKPTSTYINYEWSTGAISSAITVSQPGSYWLDVTDRNNCTGRDSILVSKKDCMEGLYVPSAFTPNGDGLNDQLIPMLFGDVKSFQFQIYNRWGEIIFRTTSPGKGWNGRVAGKDQDSNVFIWSCTYQFNGKPIESRSGKVVVVR